MKTFDDIYNEAMNIFEGKNPTTGQEDPNYDAAGKPIVQAQNPAATGQAVNPAAPVATQTQQPAGTPAAANTPPTQAANVNTPSAQTQQARQAINPIQVIPQIVNMKPEDQQKFIMQLTQEIQKKQGVKQQPQPYNVAQR
jgi:hypothetical protein